MERCEGCNRETPPEDLINVEVLECPQTHSSPAEYGVRRLCGICREPQDDDEDFHRADRIYRVRIGSQL